MYTRLIISIFAAIILILLARKYPVLSAVLYFLALVYFVAFSGGRSEISGVSFKFPLPFWRALQTRRYSPVTNRSVLNMMLFVPFGYLASTFFAAYQSQKHKRESEEKVSETQIKWWIVIGTGLFLSLMIESCQYLFHFGVFELDDLIKNTLGTAVGYGVWRILTLV